MANHRHIIISRTDRIGDVVLTLPLAKILKDLLPGCRISFLGNSYTAPVIARCAAVDEVLNIDQIKSPQDLPAADTIIHVFPNRFVAKLAKQRGIKTRIGTRNRIFHWTTCNSFPAVSRRGSNLHESQLNTKLLAPLGYTELPTLRELGEMYEWQQHPFSHALDSGRFNLALHMKSLGSAKEWELKNFVELVQNLPDNQFQVHITGTEAEGAAIREEVPEIFDLSSVADHTGQYSLPEFISFIESCDGMLACSTGPLHIAAAAGIKALGLYPNLRPMHALRWAPVGKQAQYIEEEQPSCKEDKLLNIPVKTVAQAINDWVTI